MKLISLPKIREICKPFISNIEREDWGIVIYLKEKNNKATASLYWYEDDLSTVYLSSLNVDEDIRKQGIGKKLQEVREHIGKDLGAETSCLWVSKDTWMHNWYKRRGYVDWIDVDKKYDKNGIWMKKALIKK